MSSYSLNYWNAIKYQMKENIDVFDGIYQAAAIRLEIRGGQWNEAFLQMDGEPWKQPLNNEYSTFVEIVRVPFQSVMIRGE